ncbi:MAG: ATP-binding cassette domain-containing protein, partial [Acutalibacteraceae bacterium]
TSPDGGRQNAMQLLRDMGLDKEAETAVRRLSGGMKRRVAIVRALAFGGEALLLDEPFNGLDAENRRTAAGLILKTAAENRMPVLISSHIDEDAALLKARVFKF